MSSEDKKNIKEIKIDYIETPRGKVPTLDTIRELIATWNDLLAVMNNNLEKITKLFSDIKSGMDRLELSLQKFDSKIENLSQRMIEIKSLTKEMASIAKEINKKISASSVESHVNVREKAKENLKKIFE